MVLHYVLGGENEGASVEGGVVENRLLTEIEPVLVKVKGFTPGYGVHPGFTSGFTTGRTPGS